MSQLLLDNASGYMEHARAYSSQTLFLLSHPHRGLNSVLIVQEAVYLDRVIKSFSLNQKESNPQ